MNLPHTTEPTEVQRAVEFVHLRLHSEYSLTDGIVRVGALTKACQDAGHVAAAITDISNLFATIKQHRAFHRSGIKPIIGAELWVSYSDNEDDKENLVFLVENDTGYVNLCELISQAYLDNHHDDYVAVKFEWVTARAEGLLVLSGGPTTLLGDRLIHQDINTAATMAKRWLQAFDDRYFIEIQRLGHAYEPAHNAAAMALAAELQIPLVATNDVRFLNKTDFDAHEIRFCVSGGYQLAPSGRLTRPQPYTREQYFKSPEEMATLFADIPQALANTVAIAKRCNVQLKLDQPVLPAFDVPTPGLSEADYLRQLSFEGLAQRLTALFPDSDLRESQRQTYEDRLELELQTIINMGFPGYFLIVADFIHWAQDQKIPVGPGRGSGAGSLVAYALRITNLDPLPYDLLFERFLNPERVSMPDFDIDFCVEQRDDVIQYVADKYGAHRVAQISTHGSMMARAVVRDVGRVMGYSYGATDRIAKLIPGKPGTKLVTVMKGKDSTNEKTLKDYSELYASNTEALDELHQRYERDDDDIKQLMDKALELEGIARSVGKHAAGIVIAPTKITDFSPLYSDNKSPGAATQYDKDDVEAAGLVKFDFLGLRNLTVIDWAVTDINQKRASRGETPIDIDLLPLDDPKPYQLIQRGLTTAIFQLESPGMRALIGKMVPENFEEIIALVALYRPGPLESGMTDDFCNRKHGLAPVIYLDEALGDLLKPVLEPTYGVIVYQEQVMQIAQVMAGYSLGGADLLRRAMGKKKVEEMNKQRSLFVEGSKEKNIPEAVSSKVFDSIDKFAGYGFNKSHSAAYALVSYQTAWLKTYYPAEFMAAVLSSDMDKTDKIVMFVEECRNLKIPVHQPNLNRSQYKFVASDDGSIIFGLGAIKGVGQNVIEAIVTEREANGAYQDLFEFCRRLPRGTVNKKSLEALILSGATDTLGGNRHTLFASIPEAIKLADQQHKDEQIGQCGLFGMEVNAAVITPAVRDVAEWPMMDRLMKEKAALGLFLSDHPINPHRTLVKALACQPIIDINTIEDDEQQTNSLQKNPRDILICGYIISSYRRSTKKGQNMMLVVIDDRTGQLEIPFFEQKKKSGKKKYQKADENTDKSVDTKQEPETIPLPEIEADQLVVMHIKLGYNSYRQQLRYDVQSTMSIEEAQEKYCRAVRIALTPSHAPETIEALHQTLAEHKGGHAGILLQYQQPQGMAQFRLGSEWAIKPSPDCLKTLQSLVGMEHIGINYAAQQRL